MTRDQCARFVAVRRRTEQNDDRSRFTGSDPDCASEGRARIVSSADRARELILSQSCRCSEISVATDEMIAPRGVARCRFTHPRKRNAGREVRGIAVLREQGAGIVVVPRVDLMSRVLTFGAKCPFDVTRDVESPGIRAVIRDRQ